MPAGVFTSARPSLIPGPDGSSRSSSSTGRPGPGPGRLAACLWSEHKRTSVPGGWCAGRRGGAGPDGTFLPTVPREARGSHPARWTMYFVSSRPGKRRSFKETEDKGRWMCCHQPDHRALGDPPRPFCHSVKGDGMRHAESGCPYLFGRVRVLAVPPPLSLGVWPRGLWSGPVCGRWTGSTDGWSAAQWPGHCRLGLSWAARRLGAWC